MNFNDMSIDNLFAFIQRANTAYHDNDDPIISDAEYDRGFHILRQKMIEAGMEEPSFVGAESSKGFNKVRHLSRRLSLDNAFTEDDMLSFIRRAEEAGADSFISEPKIDGLSLTLTYINGHLIKGITRGDGVEGDDVTVNLIVIKDIPKIISCKDHLEVTGEIYMNKEDFMALNNLLESRKEKLKANPRNAAAGTLRQHDIEAVKERNLSFFAYALDFIGSKNPFVTDAENMDFLSMEGFSVPEYHIVNAENFIDDYKMHNDVRSGRMYDVDGVVYKVNNLQVRKNMGIGSRTPYWGIAWKFDAEIATTHLKDVTWQVGRTYALTPVAELEPIGIGGVMVSRATLHGIDRFEEFAPSYNAVVKVRRAGDVIPEIIDIESDQNHIITAITQCPCCQSKVKRIGANLFCTAYEDGRPCRDRDIQAISYVVSRDVLNLDGVGEGVIEKLYDAGVIQNVCDLFLLNSSLKDSFRIVYPGRAGDKIIEGVEAGRKNVEFRRFISALMMPLIAKSTPKKLAELSGDPIVFYDMVLRGDDFTDLVGPARNQNINDWFSMPSNRQYYMRLMEQLEIIPMEKITSNSEWAGKTVVFTGSIGDYTRDGITSLAESLGIKVSNSVSKKTDLVVYGDKAGSKLEKAQKLGVNTITADEWLKGV